MQPGATRLGQGFHRVDDTRHQHGHAAGLLNLLICPCFATLNRKDIIDVAQKNLPRNHGCIDIALLFIVEPIVLKQLQCRDHAVERGTHLMAHHGKEARLFLISVQSFITRGDDLGFTLTLFGDVTNDEKRPFRRRGLRHRHFYGENAAILVDHLKFAAAFVSDLGFTRLAKFHQPFVVGCAVIWRNQQIHIAPAFRRFVGNSEYLLS